MTAYLTKNQPINLTDKNLKNITLGITGEAAEKLSLIVFLSDDLKVTLSKNHVISEKHNKESPCKSVVVSDTESSIKLEHLEQDVKRVVFGVYLKDLTESDSNVMSEINLYLKNNDTDLIEAKADFNDSFTTETSFILVEMYNDNGWKLSLLNQAYNGSDETLMRIMGAI